ncbi:MAG: alpha/beta hydrolase [Parasphingorhabdus sp.]|nr:alpha/beta hydrolase [Parasphingorhabdus sp.]
MPDLRGHGQSAAPHDPAAYPPDVLVQDAIALVRHLALGSYDLGGFSLGARITAKLLSDGLKPRKAILAGMGLEGLTGWAKRREFFLTAIAEADSLKRGDRHWFAAQFMKSQKIDRTAAALLLHSFTDLDPAGLSRIDTPTLVLCGAEDRDNGDPASLTQALGNAQYAEIPGTHMSCIIKPDFGEAIAAWLGR